MKFLIDECLHTSLVTLAHEAGHLCDHVNFLGLGGHKDWQLMTKSATRITPSSPTTARFHLPLR